MVSRITISKLMFLLLVVALIILGSNPQVEAQKGYVQPTPQQDIVSYLEQRLGQQNVPINQIKVLQGSPLELEVTLQSLSNGQKFAPDDSMNLHLAVREVVLANEHGYKINGLTEVLKNAKGETIDWGWTKIAGGIVYLKLAPSTMADGQAQAFAMEKIDARGMVMKELQVSSFDGFQTLRLHLSTKSAAEANRVLPQFVASLRPLTANINTRGAQIVMVKTEVTDANGQILFNYLLDLQFQTAGLWIAEGIDANNWHRPSAPIAPQ